MAVVIRCVRQICLLREQGEAEAAARLQENELGSAVRDLRLAQGPDALSGSELQTLFATEERRVAEALVLSELLIARLVETWPAGSGPTPVRPLRSGDAAPSVRARPAVSATCSPAIPDLLDAMLAAEHSGRRLSPATHRQS